MASDLRRNLSLSKSILRLILKWKIKYKLMKIEKKENLEKD